MNNVTGQAMSPGLGLGIGTPKPIEQISIVKVENGFTTHTGYGGSTNVAKTLEEALQIVTDYFAPTVPPTQE